SPIINDIKFLYEKEMEVGEYGLKVISKDLGVRLPKDEAAYIALNIINAEKSCTEKTIDYDELIDSVIQIVEKENNIKINRNDFSCSRFITHMHYMLKRAEDNHMFNSEENRFMKSMKNECQDTYECVQEISGFLKDKLSIDITEEEKLYLMMHIHRLCTREACNI
ncbi:PRD domain-containing protein, partial [Pseudobutyrivibrio sp.]